MARGRIRRKSRLRRTSSVAGIVLLAAVAVGGGATLAAAQATGPILLDEDFTAATATSDFEGYGSACLTGAAAGAAPPAGAHTLGSCSSTPTGPVPPAGGAPDGFLQLTDASNDQSGAVLYTQPLPATSGVEISFEQWQYGGTQTPAPADGISFFLVDGASTLDAPGAFGGSLGYAQKLPDDNPANTMIPGVNGGYLGIGLDVLGNYFGDWEKRGAGCPNVSPSGTGFRIPGPGSNMVTVRGPGDGDTGYCFLTATTTNFDTSAPWPSTLPGQLHGSLTAFPPGTGAAGAAAALQPDKRTVTVVITPVPDPQVTVSVDFGAGPVEVLSFPAPQPDPATYKFGFAASTGGFTDVHLIRTVRVQALDPLPQLDLIKQVDEDALLPGPVVTGDTIPYQFVLTNSGGAALTDVTVTDPLITAVSCPSTVLEVSETMTCTGTYTVTDVDVAVGYVQNTAIAGATGPGGPVESPPSSVDVPLGGTVTLELDKNVDSTVTYSVGQTVAYEYVVTNTSSATATDVAVTDDHLTGITCDTTTLAPFGTPGDSTVCRGAYTVTAADAAAGFVTNIAVATANGGSVESPPADATITVAGATPAPTTSPTVSPTTPVPPDPSDPAGTGSGSLPPTGFDGNLIVPAASLLLLGLGAVAASRQRDQQHPARARNESSTSGR